MNSLTTQFVMLSWSTTVYLYQFNTCYIILSNQVLMFNAYFKQTLNESDKEYYRVRPVKIYYYLEDDSISVIEPVIKNSGMPQGKLIKRQRLPKNDQGWKSSREIS